MEILSNLRVDLLDALGIRRWMLVVAVRIGEEPIVGVSTFVEVQFSQEH